MSGFDRLTTGGEENLVKWFLCVLFLLLTVCVATEGRVIYVDADAVGANDGSSWADAFNYLQDALVTASAGDEIRVAQGIYKPDQGTGIIPNDSTATFQLINSVTLKGGYAGLGILDPNERDNAMYETILTGDLSSNDVDVKDPLQLWWQLNRHENSHHVVTGSGTDATAVLGGD